MEQTTKLFEKDPYLKVSEAKVLFEQVRAYDGLIEVVLDQTIFYPTGGGQPHDTGYINNASVLDVYKQEGVIYHVLGESLNGAEGVRLAIDWERRFDHMQQHSGQHILSRAFEIILDAETVGFHLGEEYVTIDLTIEDLTIEAVKAVEELANKIIMENRKITKENVKADKLTEDIRNKIPELEEYVRLVKISDFDNCACAGTHPNSSSEVGVIKILGWEKYKQKTRLSFVSGNRALKVLSRFHQELLETAAILKTNLLDVKTNVNRLLDEKLELEKKNRDQQAKLLEYEVDEIKKSAQFINGTYYVEAVFQNRDFNEVKRIADGLIQSSSFIVLLATLTAEKVQFLVQRSDDLEIKANEVLKLGLEIIQGKGGGNPKTAQGGGANVAKTDQSIAEMRKAILANVE